MKTFAVPAAYCNTIPWFNNMTNSTCETNGERTDSEFHDASVTDSHFASHSASPLIQPSSMLARISFLPSMTEKMSRPFEKPVPPSPPLPHAPPASPDHSATVESFRGESMGHDHGIMTTDGASVTSLHSVPGATDNSGSSPGKIRRHPVLHKKFEPNLMLINSGSVARDHLGTERTFLAYVRTSLAIASTGVGMFSTIPILTIRLSVFISMFDYMAVYGLILLPVPALVQLFTVAANSTTTNPTPRSRIQRYARPLGATTVCFGLAVLVFGS